MRRREDIQRRVIGFLVPIFMDENPDGSRPSLYGLGPEDFDKVREGYACANCLAEFNMYTVVCPLCGVSRDLQADLKEAPRLWIEHLRERHSDVPFEKPPVVNPFASGAPLHDMETIPLSKLRKSKWGKGKAA